jgi:hypothetical protein
MDDLFEALSKNRHVRNDVTLEYVIAKTARDLPESLENLVVLMKYEEYKKVTIGVLKMRFLMKDASD